MYEMWSVLQKSAFSTAIFVGRLICNIEKSKELLYPDKDMSKHYKDSAEICNRFIKEDGMDEKYLIDMKQFED